MFICSHTADSSTTLRQVAGHWEASQVILHNTRPRLAGESSWNGATPIAGWCRKRSIYKWMMNICSPILGNPHVYTYIYKYIFYRYTDIRIILMPWVIYCTQLFLLLSIHIKFTFQHVGSVSCNLMDASPVLSWIWFSFVEQHQDKQTRMDKKRLYLTMFEVKNPQEIFDLGTRHELDVSITHNSIPFILDIKVS